jgi:ribosomal protein S18 acetylase RimI-like enzyme
VPISMQFVKAQLNQLEDIVSMYRKATRGLNRQGIEQWNEEYPTTEQLRKDIESGNMHLLMENGKIAASVVLDEQEDPEYKRIDWADDEGRWLVVHRLCVHPDWQGRGLSKRMIREIERFAKEKGYTSIRLDTMLKNEKAVNLYDSQGYERRGTMRLEEFDNELFMAFEKPLESPRVYH